MAAMSAAMAVTAFDDREVRNGSISDSKQQCHGRQCHGRQGGTIKGGTINGGTIIGSTRLLGMPAADDDKSAMVVLF